MDLLEVILGNCQFTGIISVKVRRGAETLLNLGTKYTFSKLQNQTCAKAQNQNIGKTEEEDHTQKLKIVPMAPCCSSFEFWYRYCHKP